MRDFLTNRFLNYFRQERFHIFVVYKFKSSSMNLRDIPNIPSIISPKMLNSDNAGEENSKNDLPSPTATRELGNTSAVDGFGFGPAITFDDSIQSIQNQIVGILDDDTGLLKTSFFRE